MGVDISMSMGFGVHLTSEEIKNWLGLDDGDGAYEGIENLVSKYPLLTYSYAGNAWIGEENGFVLYARSTYRDWDMGRDADAGVYKSADGLGYTGEEGDQLNQASVEVVGSIRPIEWLVTVGIS